MPEQKNNPALEDVMFALTGTGDGKAAGDIIFANAGSESSTEQNNEAGEAGSAPASDGTPVPTPPVEEGDEDIEKLYPGEAPIPKDKFKKRLAKKEEELQKLRSEIEEERRLNAQLREATLRNEQSQKVEIPNTEINREDFKAELDYLNEIDEKLAENVLKIAEKVAERREAAVNKRLADITEKTNKSETDKYFADIEKLYPDVLNKDSELSKLATQIYHSSPIYSNDISGIRESIEKANAIIEAKKARENATASAKQNAENIIKDAGALESGSGGGVGMRQQDDKTFTKSDMQNLMQMLVGYSGVK